MFRAGGYATINDPNARTVEMDTFTCGHCNKVVHVKPKCDPADLGGLCKQCMKMTCPQCASKGCTPFEKKLEAMEAKDRFYQSVING